MTLEKKRLKTRRTTAGTSNWRLRLNVAIVVVFVLVAWELSARTGLVDPRLFSSPSRVWTTGLELMSRGRVWPHLWVTAQELLVAFGIFTVVGGLLGIILSLKQSTFEISYGPIAIFFAFPKVTLYPIFLVTLGLGFMSKTLFGALFGLFPLIMSTMVGVRAVRQIHLELFAAVGAGFWFKLRRLLLPATLPYFVTGLRIGFVYAGIGILLAEMFAAVSGLGNRIISAGYQSTLDDFWVYVALSSLLLMSGAGIFRIFEVRLSRWRIS